ncbi:hypothetical protein ACI0E8_004452, partial [Vibrio alginolyticus]
VSGKLIVKGNFMREKKDREEENILSRIFKESKYCEICKSEQPDFILKYDASSIGKVDVGVEITELYFDGTSARLKNKDNYVYEILEHGNYVHKDDKEKLKVQDVKYFSQAKPGEPFDTKILMHPNYTLQDYKKSLLQTIRRKSKKFLKYNTNVNQSALVIYDKENIFTKFDRINFVSVFFDNLISKEIKSSPFDEIYLITRFKNDHNQYYVQLKYCLLQNELGVLLNYIEKNKLNGKLDSLGAEVIDLYAEVLFKKGYPSIGFSERNGNRVVNVNRYSFSVNVSDRGMSVFDDFPRLYINEHKYSEVDAKFFTEKSFSLYLKETKDKFVSFEVGFKALR